MLWFKKKEKTKKKTDFVAKECDHKYRDFKWYIESKYYMDTHKMVYKIVEPFVCIHCKHRKDVVLIEESCYFETDVEADRKYQALKRVYAAQLKDRVLLEDEIADMQLVDREYLQIVDMLHNGNKEIKLQLNK